MIFQEFLAELKTDLNQYFESGLIDDASVLRWVNQALKKFGANIMTTNEVVVEIENYKGTLPENFYSLSKALKCTKDFIKCESEEDEKILVRSFFWTDVQLKRKEWGLCTEGCVKEELEEYTISEKTYIDGRMFKKYYNHPEELRLSPYINRRFCDSDCFNKISSRSPHEINIKGNTLYTNFKEGDVFVQYRGLELDEDGVVIIPDTSKGELETYLMYFVKRNIFEIVLINGDDVNIANLFKYFLEAERAQFGLALTAVKFEGLTPSSMYKLKSRNILERKKFERIPRR